MLYLAKCDKCGRIEKMICIHPEDKHQEMGNIASYAKPINWDSTDIGDLCPKCSEDYQLHLKKFK